MFHSNFIWVLTLASWVAVSLVQGLAAEELVLLPADRPLPQVIDHYIAAHLQSSGVSPTARADDATFLRRLTLDLAGRIPTAAEQSQYLTSTATDKPALRVDELMASDGFVRHHVNELDVLLMSGDRGSVKKYLTTAVKENRSWDKIFREVVLADQTKEGEAGEFLKYRVDDLDKLVNDVSVKFFGVNVSCAKCHDHPLVADWTQHHFYGMKSFFGRMFKHGDSSFGERGYGLTKFKNAAGEEFTATLMFLSGTKVDEPADAEPSRDEQKRESDMLKELAKKKEPAPAPSFSRRAQLVEVALREQENMFFARAIVNRLWYRFYGHGLVMPLDQMHSENPPTHPELLDWLARDLIANGFDLRRTIRGMVLSDTYARSSRWEYSTPRPAASVFAVAAVRPLSPAQYAAALRLGVADPQQFAAERPAPEVAKRIEDNSNGGGLQSYFEQPDEDFQVGVNEALLMSNGARVQQDLLKPGGRMVDRLKDLPTDADRLNTISRNVLCRTLDEEELKLLSDYLAARADRAVEAYQQIIWSMLTSSECRFNY